MRDFYLTLPPKYKWLTHDVRVRIPKGFIFDGASVPRMFWVSFSPTGILFIPSVIHDFAYRNGYIPLDRAAFGGPKKSFEKYGLGKPKKFWDDLFYDMAVDINGFKWVNRAPWFFVRLFGRGNF